ncbi:hypothetical protein RJ639_024544 [Escallonia herrerae]|uniref:Uncharacterized protein n=1 Tax=Escallonia herrerae TaxID=1293975 RepID=A0AA88V091_9ASTE|nr:hypothetical protein RJ639_024544 [Escallonia herrerae]
MGMVVVISLPLILFSVMLGFGCYFLGRSRGRQDVRTNAQVFGFGVPTPPPGSAAAASYSSPPPAHFKPDNFANMNHGTFTSLKTGTTPEQGSSVILPSKSGQR